MRRRLRFLSQSNIDYLNILDYEHIYFLGRENPNDDDGHPIGTAPTSFTFESPIEGDVKIQVEPIFNDSKSIRNMGRGTNQGYMTIWVNNTKAKGLGKLNLGSTLTNGEDTSAAGTTTAYIKKGTNTIKYQFGVDRYERIITTSVRFTIKILVLKVKGEYIPFNI